MAGIYVHIPFCHSKCAYCDFYSMASLGRVDQYVDALLREYGMRCHEIGPEHKVRTIYFGGGTPSILSPTQLGRIIDALPMAETEEVTIEANPEDVDAITVRQWRSMGINRISMGVQSMVDAELSIIGRRHSGAQAIKAAEDIVAGGITNFSLDLIYGLPGQTQESWEHSLRTMLALKPKHFSAYMLTYEPRTRLTAMLKKGEVREATEDEAVAYYHSLTAEARANGYAHYEISNFAIPGYESRHNSAYWDGTPYLGLGPAAHSYDGATRRFNPSNLKAYLDKIEAGQPACEIDEEDDNNRFNDLIITSLRTARGLDLSRVPSERMRELRRSMQPFISSGDIVEKENRIWIPEDSWLISDSIISDLMQV